MTDVQRAIEEQRIVAIVRQGEEHLPLRRSRVFLAWG